MRIHREGVPIIAITILVFGLINALVAYLFPIIFPFLLIAAIGGLIWVIQFFRDPVRQAPTLSDKEILAPADGKVVVIEETEEKEFFKDKRIQLSIFMSPTNVHVNRNPVNGSVEYYKYHPGKYLVAWHPKSSTENERTTIVYNTGKAAVLMRQIAGAMARRIKTYLKEGDQVTQGGEMGFIRFGSRVDVFLPLDAEILVNLDQKVKGKIDVLAKLP